VLEYIPEDVDPFGPPMTTIIKHADLGEVKGNVVDGIAQFLGLQYASLENRFAPSAPKTEYVTSIDATKYGQVPQPKSCKSLLIPTVLLLSHLPEPSIKNLGLSSTRCRSQKLQTIPIRSV
jgi:hypothetical protein